MIEEGEYIVPAGTAFAGTSTIVIGIQNYDSMMKHNILMKDVVAMINQGKGDREIVSYIKKQIAAWISDKL